MSIDLELNPATVEKHWMEHKDAAIFLMSKGFFEHVMRNRIPFGTNGAVPQLVADHSIAAARAFYEAWGEEVMKPKRTVGTTDTSEPKDQTGGV